MARFHSASFHSLAKHFLPLTAALADLNMPWIEFEKSEKELGEMFIQIFDNLECVLFETYSEPNSEIKQFDSAKSIHIDLSSLIESHGVQLSIWCSNVMPRPQFRSIELREGGNRQAVDGCGLFSLQLEGNGEGASISGKIGYFTESEANNKYTGLNGAESVEWANHKQAVRLLKMAVLQTK